MTDKLSNIAAKSLGDSTSYAVFTDTFDASLLNPMPRKIARDGHGIKGTEFQGADLWTCHEATFLLDNGLPVAGTLRFIYGADSELMIESKSAKLYLNSFDMCRMGPSYTKAVENYENQVKNDLEKTLGVAVEVKFFGDGFYQTPRGHVDLLYGHTPLTSSFDPETWKGFTGAINSETLLKMKFDDYTGQKNHVKSIETGNRQEHKYYTNILRSRCRHTKQKDTGVAGISYLSTKFISPPSLLKQIVSLREVNEFHEFCAEKLFVSIAKKLNKEDNLSVALLYSRRGSLDINPIRYRGHPSVAIKDALNIQNIVKKAQGQ